MRATFPRELRLEIGREAVSGGKIEQLADKYGCHPASVVMWAAAVREGSEEPLPLPHPGSAGHPAVLRRIVTEEYAAGATAEEVGHRHGVSAATVGAWSRA